MNNFYNNYTPDKSIMSKKILDEEITWRKDETIVSKTNQEGIILYVNDVFTDASEYSKLEVIGESHNIVRHPNMPKVIFKTLWETLKKGENFHAIVKNLTKTGRYYWVISDFSVDRDKDNNITGYTARTKAVPQGVINKIEPFYNELLVIENQKGDLVSKLYFDAHFREEIKKSYNSYVIELFEEEFKKEKKKDSLGKTLDWFFLSEYEEDNE